MKKYSLFIVLVVMFLLAFTGIVNADSNNYPNCLSIKQANSSATDGIYIIDPDGDGSNPSFEIYCHNMDSSPKEYILEFSDFFY